MPTFTVFKGSEEGKIVKSQTTRPDLKGDDVLVKITASGVCGTDVHYLHSDIVLGHEGAGVVEEVGPDATMLKKGDRVGWGYLHSCCGHCDKCLGGREQYCADRKWFGEEDLDQGSFGSHAVWKESWLFKIPDEISDVDAAPLMCGGATVFEALRSYDIKPIHRVAVMGVGGLGHLAIQFAAKMGCDVLVLSGTDSKKEEALKLGAKGFVATKGKEELDVGRKIDVLIVTTSFSPGKSSIHQYVRSMILISLIDWSVLLPTIASNGIIFPITISFGDFTIPQLPVVQRGITIQGSTIPGRAVHREMLEFAALHGIKPMNMEFPMTEDGITKAMEMLTTGKMRYRGVLIPQN